MYGKPGIQMRMGKKLPLIHTSRPGLTFNNSGPLCSQLTEERDGIWLESTGLRGQADSHCQTARPTPVKVSGLGTLFTRLLLLED